MTVASATPPIGEIKYTDYARAQTVEQAAVPITGGSNLVTGVYSIAAGGGTGWRRLPGTMVLAVTKGKLMLDDGEGCAAKDYDAGHAALVPAGTYRVNNATKEPLEFFGVFFDQSPGAPEPLTEGPTDTAPADCSGVSGLATGVSPAGLSLAAPAVGTFSGSAYNNGATLQIEGGKDLFATRYEVGPGATSGWVSHRPSVDIVEKGEVTYVEGKDGKCDESEVYRAGQAFYHPLHRHMAVNKGTEPLVITAVYFNLPHETALPAVGNQLTAIDFTQAPPADCPRLK
ncbi:MAG: hypothetical protein LC792_28290 [Actinobacteria bacterium]|nr:hypothetical protein [Actinomycetota bacterium]